MGQAFFDPNSVAAAQHSPCYSSSSHYAPFAQDSPHGSYGPQAATPPPPFLQTSTPHLHSTHQSAFLDWTAPALPPGEGAISFPPVAIKQEETEHETGFMPYRHHAAGRPGDPSSLGYSAGACRPALLHGDSGISAGSQVLLDMDLRPRNGTPTSRRDDPLKVPSPYAPLRAPMTQGLKKSRGATARKPSAAAGRSPMTNDMEEKKVRGPKVARAALASLQSPAAEHRGKKRKGEQWEDKSEDAAAIMSGLDVLFELGDDMDIDSGLADMTAADMPAAAAAAAPHTPGSASAAPQPDSTAQLMQSAAGPPRAFTAHFRESRSPAVQRDVHAAADAGAVRQQKSSRQGSAARAASGGCLSRTKQPAMPFASNMMPVPSAEQSVASASPPAAASHYGQGSAAAAQTGAPVTLPGHGQTLTKVARRVKGSCPKKTCEYEESEVVWAQSKGHPWWPAMVQKPTKAQEQVTKMTGCKVFVVYFGTKEIEAVTQRCIQPWSAMIPPTAPEGSLKAAVDLARDFVHSSTAV
ncbi:TPA: hypothetical protein ACH3X1_002580 [Trebouxia sp. C0004]